MVITSKYKSNISSNDINLFLSIAGNSLKSFRYFNSRGFDVLNNHIHTLLVYDNELPIGYGHLDKDNETVWLGICVIEVYKEKGIGKMIISNLVDFAKKNNIENIKLSVDDYNINAIELYKKYGFLKVNELKKGVVLMELNLNNL